MGAISYSAVGEKRADRLSIYCPKEISRDTLYVFKTVNKIDYSNFETIHFIIEIPSYTLTGTFSFGLFKGENSYYDGAAGHQVSGVVADIASYEKAKCSKKEISIPLPQNSTEDLYAFIGGFFGGDGESGELFVYEVWFE